MQNSIAISIIIPVYNVEKYIYHCVSTIISQSLDKDLYEILIINDGTPDKSLEVITPLVEKYSNIHVFTQENKGVSSARNLGIRHAKGDYILFVDGDDALAAGCLPSLVNSLKVSSCEVLIMQSHKHLWQSDKVVEQYPFRSDLENKYHKGIDLFNIYQRGSVCGVAFSRDFLLTNLIFFSEGMKNAEDSLFFYEVFAVCDKMSFAPIPCYIVNERMGSASTNVSFERALEMLQSQCAVETVMMKYKGNEKRENIFYARIYANISNFTYYYSLLPFRFKAFLQWCKAIKNSAVYPIPRASSLLNSKPVVLLNFSVVLFVVLFFLRKAFRKLV